jgi:hypothetical protein
VSYSNRRDIEQPEETAMGGESQGRASLAGITPVDTVVVRRFLFSRLGNLCAELGFREGDAVTCTAQSAARLFLRTPTGRTVALERDQARFVEVVRGPLPAPLSE